MCGCAWNFTCSRCQPRLRVDLGLPDWRELEQERWDSLISTPDYAKGLDK